MKRLNKQHFKVLMKIWLNAGRKTNRQIIEENEMREFNELVEAGYVEIVEQRYSHVPFQTGFGTVMENFLTNLEIMNTPHVSPQDTERRKPENPVLDMKVDELDLPVRCVNCLQTSGLMTVRDVVQKNRCELLKIKNFGKWCLTHLEDVLGANGLYFGMKNV